MSFLGRLGMEGPVERFLELLFDNATTLGRLVTTAVVVAVATALALGLGRLAARRADDAYARYYARKLTRYAVTVVTLIGLAIYWRPFGGQLAAVLGLATAGIAFAMQEVVGALAGFFNIASGRIFRVGDRIQLGGVRGDVIDITPLRTKIMEMGSSTDGDSWVRGRQYTGRVVAVSNKATFTEPVYNYSGVFDYIWEELTVPVPYDSDWRRAEAILREEVERVSSSEGAQEAIATMTRRYPIARADVEPRVFTRATDNWNELSARFVLPVRAARRVKDEVTRRVLDRFREEGIRVASQTAEVTLTVEDS